MLPSGLEMISDSETLLNYPFKSIKYYVLQSSVNKTVRYTPWNSHTNFYSAQTMEMFTM